MIGDIVAVAMHRPIEIFFEPVGMAMAFDHFQMLLDCVDHGWRVGVRRRNGPYENRQA